MAHLDFELPADDVIYAADFNLEMGDWSADWLDPACPLRNGGARRNAEIIQRLLDLLGERGGGKLVLPPGIITLERDRTHRNGKSCIEFRYDNLTLEGNGNLGPDRTTLKVWEIWSQEPFSRRNSGMRIIGEPFNNPERKARQNITIRNLELYGGRPHSGEYMWDFQFKDDKDYGWDIRHQGIACANDNQVNNVFLDTLYIHGFSGETLYNGGQFIGYLKLTNSIMTDTNASCFNLHAAVLHVYNNQFGSPACENRGNRFWIEFCNRRSVQKFDFDVKKIPGYEHYAKEFAAIDGIDDEGFTMDTSYFYNNRFYSMVGAEGIVLTQGNATTYRMYFVNNHFDNMLDYNAGGDRGMFMFGGSVYGPIFVRNNTFENVGGYLVNFWWGGGAEDEHGKPDHMLNKNLFFEGNRVKNIGGPVIKMEGAWGNGFFSYPEGEEAAKATGRPYITQYNDDGSIKALITYGPLPVENFVVKGNHIIARDENTPILTIDSPYCTTDGVKDPLSGMDIKDVQIFNNHFVGGAAPQERGPFMGKLPLFAGNAYENVHGGLAVLSENNNTIAPLYENLQITTTQPIQAVMRVGVYQNGQKVTLTGAAGTSEIRFVPGEATYNVPEPIALIEGVSLCFYYNACTTQWELKM
ncbi:MAG: hypothetical protein FWE90_02320 [Defluviitaleaceae bacterium]|nr:hypothetical protein [Defluviitaleaceae bacterium]